MTDLRIGMKLHFIGIGGAGMLPLALHAAGLGCRVEGSDLSAENFHILEKARIHPLKGHGSVMPDTDLVVYSSAVAPDNPELVSAANGGIPAVKRAVFLDMVSKDRHSVLVTGSHGKSTVTAMLADMMNPEPYRACAIVGAETVSQGSNYYPGDGDRMIIEADEYDRSFLRLHPKDLIILNIDDDHMDVYGDMNGLKSAFCELTGKLNGRSLLVYNGDDINAAEVIKDSPAEKISYGFGAECNYRPGNIVCRDFRTSFDLLKNGDKVCRPDIFYTGKLNVYNMLAASAYLHESGAEGPLIEKRSGLFRGVRRRTEIIFSDGEYILIDDYGHHPSEIKASLWNIRQNIKGRLTVMFQPHLYSRTKYHLEGFAGCFDAADLVYISQIYPAREKYDPTVASTDIFDRMKPEMKRRTLVFSGFSELYASVREHMRPGDVIVSMGAGEINKVLYKIKEDLGK